jgi:hypothetical protein
MVAFRTPEQLSGDTGRVFRPVMAVRLTVPVAGTREQRIDLDKKSDVVTFTVYPKRVRIERNDHNHADTCSIALDWTMAGVDARMLDDATAEVHLDNADANGIWLPSEKSVRFAGVVKEVDSSRSGDEAAEVTLECVDYTELFLTAKPFGSSGVPKLSQTIKEAWQTIVAQTPGAEVLANRIVFEGVDPATVIGKGVPERFRRLDYVQTKPETDGWAVWMTTVGMLGLISFIHKDTCIVTTATNYYTEQDAPKMVWGQNILSWHENRATALARKGVCISSYDPLSRQTREAYWPPIGDERIKRKRKTSKKVLTTDQIRQREERDYFTSPGITNEAELEAFAQRVYEERSRQELEGSISTPLMWVETEGHKSFDLLDLRAGETVRVEVEPGQRQLLASLATEAERLNYLAERGYSEGAAQLIVSNMKNFADLDARFLTKAVTLECEVDEDSGSFNIDIDYVNRIQIDGGAK